MWELDYKESWAPKNWCFWTVVLEKTLESPLDCKEIKPVHPTGNQLWIFIRRTDAEAPILRLPDLNSQLVGKDPDAGRDWGQEEKGVTEDEMVGWSHWLNGHESGQTLGDGEGQGSLGCCSPRGCKELDTTEWLNNSDSELRLWSHIILYWVIYCIQVLRREQSSWLLARPQWPLARPHGLEPGEMHALWFRMELRFG